MGCLHILQVKPNYVDGMFQVGARGTGQENTIEECYRHIMGNIIFHISTWPDTTVPDQCITMYKLGRV